MLTLALGMAPTAIAYSVLAGTVFRDLPFRNSEQLVSMKVRNLDAEGLQNVPLGLFLRWRESTDTLDALAAYIDYRAFVTREGGGTTVYAAASVTPEFFDLLGVEPAVGPGFDIADRAPNNSRVALLSHRAWTRDFGRDPEIVGYTFRVNDEPTTIVGVLPQEMDFPSGQDIWLAMRVGGSLSATEARLEVVPVGRLGSHVSLEAVREELGAITATYDGHGSARMRDLAVAVESFVVSQSDPHLRSSILPMLLAMGAILVLACGNVANLVLARVTAEQHSVAVKTALGASRLDIAISLSFETLALALAGALLALPLTILGVAAFNHFMEPSQVFYASWVAFEVDLGVVAFLILAGVGSGVLASLLPAFRRSTARPAEAFGAGSRTAELRRSGLWSHSLMTLELTMATGLVFVAGLLIQNVMQLRQIDLGVEDAGVVVAKLSTFTAREFDEAATRQFFAELARKLEAVPGVESVAFATSIPTEGAFPRSAVFAERPDPVPVGWVVASPKLFETLGVQLLQGRDFNWASAEDRPHDVIVNSSFARRFLADGAVGSTLQLIGSGERAEPVVVVGVVADYLMAPPDEVASRPAVFTSLAQDPRSSVEMIVKAEPGFMIDASALCREAFAVHSEAACFDTRSLGAVVARRVWIYDALATLFSSLGLLALVLGITGSFGVMSFLAGRRRREMGLRFALGATKRSIERLVLRRFAVPALLGLVLGLSGGVVVARFLSSLLYGIESWDPLVVVVTTVVLAVPCGIAVYLPARGVATADPMDSLRLE